MATKHIAAVCVGTGVGVAYVTIYSWKHHALSGIDVALPQALAAITLVFNIALMIDLIRFEPSQFGDLVQSRNTLISGTFLICFLAPWYMINGFIALLK